MKKFMNAFVKMLCMALVVVMSVGFTACGFIGNEADIETEESSKNEADMEKEVGDNNNRPMGNFCVKDEDGNILITVNDLADAKPMKSDELGNIEYCVALTFTKKGAEKLERVTEENIDETIYFYVDDNLVLSPRVMGKITDGQAMINGLDSYEEACDLVDAIYKK